MTDAIKTFGDIRIEDVFRYGLDVIEHRPGRILARASRSETVTARLKLGLPFRFQGQLSGLRQPKAFERLFSAAVRNDWIVYARPPFGGPQQVLKYLARYTHRVAISNSRLISMADGKVTFGWKDYAEGNRKKTMTLSAAEFLRRFLMHVLPSGFMRIRHFGFLANRSRRTKLDLCRQHLGVTNPSNDRPCENREDRPQAPTECNDSADGPRHHARCPACKSGRLVTVEVIPRVMRHACFPITWGTPLPIMATGWDTS